MAAVLRTAGRLAAIGVLAVFATGCLRAHQDLTLNEDDTVDGTIIFAVDRQLLEISGQSLEDFLQEMGTDTGLPEGIDAEQTPYEEGDFVGSEFTFSGAPLEVWNNAGEANRVSITREGDTFVVSGIFDATGEEFVGPDLPGAEGLLEGFDVRVSVTFPGDVASHNGELDGTTVTWRLEFGQVNQIEAVGSAIGDGGGGGGAILVWVLLVVAVAAGTALVMLLVSSRRRQTVPATRGAAEEATGAAPEATSPVPPPTPVGEPPPAPVPVEPSEAPATEPVVEPPRTAEVPPDGGGEVGGDAGGGEPGGTAATD